MFLLLRAHSWPQCHYNTIDFIILLTGTFCIAVMGKLTVSALCCLLQYHVGLTLLQSSQEVLIETRPSLEDKQVSEHVYVCPCLQQSYHERAMV